MVSQEADVGLLTSSAQIFASNHTLPQIRQIHKALHVQVDDKAARLRTQVGGSYRELLGTADTIVQMRSDMQGAQSTLAGMGGRCGRAVVGGKVSALASFIDNEQEQSSLSLAARAKLLEACARTVGRLLSRKASDTSSDKKRPQNRQQQTWGERLVLASKVLVLSRLLISSIDESSKTEKAAKGRDSRKSISRAQKPQDSAVLVSIEASKRTLGSLRRRLRDIIEILERTVPAATATSTSSTTKQPAVNFNSVQDDDSGSDDEQGGLRGHKSSAFAAASSLEDLLRALCAHSLATTSGARDLLWQLLHVRSQAMALAFDLEGDYDSHNQQNHSKGAAWKPDNVIRGLALYTKTLLDVQALLPHKLPEALLGLKRRALLDDNDLRQIEGLRLDVYAQWCGEDVQYFKPYIRHDDLDAAQARDMLSKWAERGSDVLLAGLQRALEQQKPTDQQSQQPPRARRQLDLDAIVDLRTRVLQLWIRDSGKARGFDSSELLEKMRDVFNKQMLDVLSTKVAKLRLVGSEVAATLAVWQDGVTDRHSDLWKGDFDTDLHDGAVSFVRQVTARLHGRSDAVAKAIASYATWRHVVDDVNTIVDQLRRQRWDNDVDDIVEDEETLAERQQLLSRQDPQRLQDHLEATLGTAFTDLNAQIVAEWTKVAESSSISDTAKGHIAMYLIRVLREIRSNRPSVEDKAASTTSKLATPTSISTAPLSASSKAINELGLEIIPALHAAVARIIVADPLEQLATKVLTRKTVAGRLLWDEPGQQLPLPSTPSPGVFKFLRDLSASMGDAGMDLWSPAALAQLKQQAAANLSEQWTTLLETAEHLQEGKAEVTEKEDKTTDKDDEDDEEKEDKDVTEAQEEKVKEAKPSNTPDSQRRDIFTQWLFDIAWLRCGLDVATSSKTKTSHSLAKLEDAVYDRTGLDAKEAESSAGKTPRQRINKSAQEYWKKTSLLFGLLA